MNTNTDYEPIDDQIEQFKHPEEPADCASKSKRRRLPELPENLDHTIELNPRLIADICTRAAQEWRRVVIEQPARANIDFLRAIHVMALINRTLHYCAEPPRANCQTERLFTDQ